MYSHLPTGPSDYITNMPQIVPHPCLRKHARLAQPGARFAFVLGARGARHVGGFRAVQTLRSTDLLRRRVEDPAVPQYTPGSVRGKRNTCAATGGLRPHYAPLPMARSEPSIPPPAALSHHPHAPPHNVTSPCRPRSESDCLVYVALVSQEAGGHESHAFPIDESHHVL